MQPTPSALRDALLADWREKMKPSDCIAVTLTFRRFVKGRRFTDRERQEALRHFLRRMDNLAFGRRAIRGAPSKRPKVQRITVREGGERSDQKRPHYHLQMEVPSGHSQSSWAKHAAETWQQIEWASPRENVFRAVLDGGWLDYILKLRDKPCFIDAVDFENCWVN